MWRWDRHRNKDCEKEIRKWEEKREREQIQCEPFLFTQMKKRSSGLLSTPVRDVHVHQTFARLPRSHDDKRSTDFSRGTAFFNMSGGKRGQWRNVRDKGRGGG